MQTEEGRKAFACVKRSSSPASKWRRPRISDLRPLPCLPFCPMSQVAMVWGSQ